MQSPRGSEKGVPVLRVLLVVVLLALVACTHEASPPPVPPPPEDLSTWAVPELVQPPPRIEESTTPATQEKPSPAEQVLDYQPGGTYTVSVPLNMPLDVVLQAGEQVRNIVG